VNDLQIPTKVFSRHVLGPGAEDSEDRLLYEENGGPECFVDISITKDGAYLTINANSRNSSEVRGSSETRLLRNVALHFLFKTLEALTV
jgi:protease II